MSTHHTAWKEAAWIFVLSRFVGVILTYVGMSFMSVNGTSKLVNCFQSHKSCIISWLHYDVFSFIDVTMHGYANVKATAFFPLYPLLLRPFGVVLGESVFGYYIAGIILSNTFFFFTLVVLYILVDEMFDASIARNALFYIAFAPYALFFFIGYSESLFMLLCVLTFFFLERANQRKGLRNWWLAGLCGFLAALSRSQGVLMVFPFMVVYIRHYFQATPCNQTGKSEKILALLPLVLIPLGVVAYMLYLWRTQGDPWLFSKAEIQIWGRSLTFPLKTLYTVVKELLWSDAAKASNILNLACFLIPTLVLAIGWRRIPFHYSIFTVMILIFAILFPMRSADSLTAVPRFMLEAFPVIIILASWKHPRFEKAYLALTIPLFVFNILQFIHHYWVA